MWYEVTVGRAEVVTALPRSKGQGASCMDTGKERADCEDRGCQVGKAWCSGNEVGRDRIIVYEEADTS